LKDPNLLVAMVGFGLFWLVLPSSRSSSLLSS